MATLEKDLDYKEEYFDFIQEHLRKFCLQYGAALFYTSVKEDKNCDLLYKYLVHRIYGLVFPTPALVVEKDEVFMYVFFFLIAFCLFFCCILILNRTLSFLLLVLLDGITTRRLPFSTKTCNP